MNSKSLAKYIRILAESERALAHMGAEFAPFVADLLVYAADAIEEGAAPNDVVLRLKDMGADFTAVRVEIDAKADTKFNGDDEQ